MAGELTSCAERGVTARLTEKLNWTVKCEESAAGQVSVDDKMGEKSAKNQQLSEQDIHFINLYLYLYFYFLPYSPGEPCIVSGLQ